MARPGDPRTPRSDDDLLHRAGEAIGPFELIERLGVGGAGEVWRARMPGQPLDVALKLLRDEWSPRALARFLAEARAAAGLDHPHLVQVLDYGVDDDGPHAVPYLAMDLATGGTLTEATLDHTAQGTLEWAALHGAVAQVMAGLAHAHARGVIHLDVKGDNVLLGTASDGRAGWRVVDFGIAHAAGRSPTDARVSGTPTHMAPEQWQVRAGALGPWTDVYALGCTVWELVTGAPPYDGGVMQQAMAHTTGRLPQLLPVVPVPPGLPHWLARAMGTRPEDRFRHMADAAASWHDLGVAEVVSGPMEVSSPRPSRPLLPPLPSGWHQAEPPATPLSMGGLGLGVLTARRPPMVGRARGRDRLWSALRALVEEGEGRRLWVHGPPGVGTSRLAAWLAELASTHGVAQGWVVRHGPGEDGLRGAARRWLGWDGPLGPVERRERLMRFVMGLQHPVDPRDVDLWDAWLASDGPASKGAGRALVAALTRDRPLVLVLDEADRAPEALELADRVADVPVLVLATSTEPSPEGWASLALAPLDEPALRHVVEALLPLTPSASARLVQAAAGHPHDVLQRLVAHARRGELVPVGDRYDLPSSTAPLPDDVDELWDQRVASAVEGMAQVDDALAVLGALGPEFDGARWHRIATPSPRLMQRLVGAGLLVTAPRAARWRLVHPRLVGALRRRAGPERWRAAHARCAEGEDDPARRGAHLLAADDLEAAADALLEGARSLRRRGHPQRAAALLGPLETALGRAPDDDPRRVHAAILHGRLLGERHGAASAIEASEAALALARAHGSDSLVAMAGTALASTMARAGKTTEALALAESLLAEFVDHVDDVARGSLWGHVAALRSYHAPGDPAMSAKARQAAEKALSCPTFDGSQRGDMMLYLARLSVDEDDAVARLAAAAAQYRDVGSLMGGGMCEHDLARRAAQRGDLDQALEHFRASAWYLDRAAHNAVANAWLGEGTTLMALQRHDEAEPVLRKVLGRGRRVGHGAFVFAAGVALASLAVVREDWRAADALLGVAEAVDLGRKLQAEEVTPLFVDSATRAEAAGQSALAARLRHLEAQVQQ